MDRRQARKATALDAVAKSGGNLTNLIATPAIHVETFTNVVVADVDAFMTASVLIANAGAVTYTDAADFDGNSQGATLSPPRPVQFVMASSANWAAGNIVVTGTDIYGAVMTETLAMADNGNETITGDKCFATIVSVLVPAGDGTGTATGTMGFAAGAGLTKPAVTASGEPLVIAEFAGGTQVTSGVFGVAATAEPNGSYIPDTAFDGTLDHALVYIVSSLV